MPPQDLSQEQARSDAGAAALLLVHSPELSPAWSEDAIQRLRRADFCAEAHVLGARALESDRQSLQGLEAALESLRQRPGVDAERLGMLGIGRGGTLAFLFACTRRLAAVVDVEGPLLYPALTRVRPTQPLELALNLEGAFLGLFGAQGPVGKEERELLRAQLTSAAKPFELVVLPGNEIVVERDRRGYDEARAKELWRRILAFLREALAGEPE